MNFLDTNIEWYSGSTTKWRFVVAKKTFYVYGYNDNGVYISMLVSARDMHDAKLIFFEKTGIIAEGAEQK